MGNWRGVVSSGVAQCCSWSSEPVAEGNEVLAKGEERACRFQLLCRSGELHHFEAKQVRKCFQDRNGIILEQRIVSLQDSES
jgi:hypothetical protein